MGKVDTIIAVFKNRGAAETAVKKLAAEGFDMKNLSVVGKGFHSEEKVVGFYSTGDGSSFGARAVRSGGSLGLFFGALFLTIQVVGHLVELGYLAAVAVGALENVWSRAG